MTNITISLNAKLQPMHRHNLEDALQEQFEEIGLDAEPTGGGSSLEDNGEIASSDIEVILSDGTDENVKKIIDIIEAMLAPIGSHLYIYPDDEKGEVKKIPIGAQEGLGLYLSQDLEDKVYEEGDVNHVYDEIERLLGDFKTGHIASFWEGEETALYLYGKSFQEMHKLIKPLLDEYPLCQKCRVVKIA